MAYIVSFQPTLGIENLPVPCLSTLELTAEYALVLHHWGYLTLTPLTATT